MEVELNNCLKAKGKEGFFYKSEELASPSIDPVSTIVPAVDDVGGAERVTNDNDNLTLPPTTPGVDIEVHVILSKVWPADQLSHLKGKHQPANSLWPA